MALKYLNFTGLSTLVSDIKTWVLARIPTKTSEITNDSGFLTSHQSLSNYSTLANTIKSLSISGKTITYTKGNNTTGTLTTQDTNTDTLMTQNVSTANATYPVLLVATADATANQGAKTGIFAKSVKVNPNTNVISASGFSGPLTGNVTGNCSGSSGSCTGNAATATQFSSNATVALTGDATGTSAGSKKGWSVPVTLANSGVTAGSYGPSADVTGNNNATISVPEITVDAKGRVTSVTNRTLTCKNNTYNVYNKTLTIQKNGTNVATFTSNSNTDVTANITVPTKTSELTNDSGYLTSHQSLSNYVTLNGTQTISGAKTFSGGVTLSSMAKMTVNHATVVKGTNPSSVQYWQIFNCDKNGGNWGTNTLSIIEGALNANGKSSIYFRACKNETNSTASGTLAVVYDSANNKTWAECPTPDANSNDTKIATTAWVTAKGYLTAHQSLSNYVTLNSAQTITGAKTVSQPISSSVSTQTWLNGNNGTAIINSTAAAGSYVALIKSNSTNGHFTLSQWNAGVYLNYTVGTETSNKTTKSAILMDESGNSTFPGTITASGFSGNVTGNCSGSSGSCTGNAATAYNIAGSNYNVVKGTNPSSQQWITSWIKFEKTGIAVKNRLSEYRACVNTDGSVDNELVSWCFASGSTGAAVLGVKCKADGSGYAYCPTPATSDNSTKIATTAFVKANAYTHPTSAGNKHIPSGGSADQYLKYSASGTAVWADLIPIFSDEVFRWEHTVTVSAMNQSSEWEAVTGGYKYTASISLGRTRLSRIYLYLTTEENDLVKVVITNGYVFGAKNCVDNGKNSVKADTTTYGNILTQTATGSSRLNCLFCAYNTTVTLTITYTANAHTGGANPSLSGVITIWQ